MNRCQDCRWSTKETVTFYSDGFCLTCENPSLGKLFPEKYDDEGVSPDPSKANSQSLYVGIGDIQEPVTLLVGPDFGCLHWEGKG